MTSLEVLAHLMVWPVRLVTPVMFLSCPLLLHFDSWALLAPSFADSWVHYLLLSYSLSDILFYIWFRRTLRKAQEPNSPPLVRLDEHQRVWKVIANSALEGEEPFDFLSTWFPIPLPLVGRNDMKNCLAVAFFGVPLERLAAGCEEVAEVERMFDNVEKTARICFPKESPVDMPPVHMLPVDPVPSLHRPLFVYLSTSLLDVGSDFAIWACGFKRHCIGQMSFWHRKGKRKPPKGPWDTPVEEAPVVFVHGVGLGLVTYLPFLVQLFNISKFRSVLLIELPHVSMKLNLDKTPTIQQIADSTEYAMHQLDVPPAMWVCHSLGTFVFAGVNRLKPHLVDSCVLIDPVCFRLWEATTMHNFCYCDPKTPMQIVQQYHVCKELLISWYFHRHFFFTDAVLLREDVPRRALMIISESDNIYDVPRVVRYLSDAGIDMISFPDTPHGGWIISPSKTAKVLHGIATLYDKPL